MPPVDPSTISHERLVAAVLELTDRVTVLEGRETVRRRRTLSVDSQRVVDLHAQEPQLTVVQLCARVGCGTHVGYELKTKGLISPPRGQRGSPPRPVAPPRSEQSVQRTPWIPSDAVIRDMWDKECVVHGTSMHAMTQRMSQLLAWTREATHAKIAELGLSLGAPVVADATATPLVDAQVVRVARADLPPPYVPLPPEPVRRYSPQPALPPPLPTMVPRHGLSFGLTGEEAALVDDYVHALGQGLRFNVFLDTRRLSVGRLNGVLHKARAMSDERAVRLREAEKRR